MGKSQSVSGQLGLRIRAERRRRDWTQGHLADVVNERIGQPIYSTTIAKIEAGSREPRPVELVAFADTFGLSTDALLGRTLSQTDFMWAVSKLAGNAQKVAADVGLLGQRVLDDIADVQAHANGQSIDDLMASANQAMTLLHLTNTALNKLAAEFPLPGMKFGPG